MLATLIGFGGLRPEPSGLGTHRQLGLAACSWHVERGYVCPTCGVTTAFTLATQGRLIDAVATQPFGALLAMAAGAAFWLAGWAAWSGSGWSRWVMRRALRPAVGALAGLVLMGGWAYRLIVG
jgi:hypothetical protein